MTTHHHKQMFSHENGVKVAHVQKHVASCLRSCLVTSDVTSDVTLLAAAP